MAERMEVDGVSFPECYKDVPVIALRTSCVKRLSLFLNLEREIFSDNGVLSDYNGLAELLDFDSLEIQNFRRQKNPTEAILLEWQQRPDLKPTVGRLVECLQEMGREDVLTDCMPSMIKDAKAFVNKRTQFNSADPIQDPSVSSSPAPLRCATDHHVNENQIITVQDAKHGCPQYYDAFVCYNPEGQDLAFVKEMLQVLESDKYGLKMFVPSRDDLPGPSEHTVSATLIQERCKRMVIIMSQEYLNSPACDFQTKFAHSLSPGARSKKLVPILIEDCCIPAILRHVLLCDYTKADLKEWFWNRLAWTIKAPIDPKELEYEQDVRLSDICLNVSTKTSKNFVDSSPPKASYISSGPSMSNSSSSSSSSKPSSFLPPASASRSTSSTEVIASTPMSVSPGPRSVTEPLQRSPPKSSNTESSPVIIKKFPCWKSSSKKASSYC